MPSSSVVPACPQGLSIHREDFLLEPFSVDAFLSHWHTSAAASPGATGRPRSLETLRDDLGIYLKVLRSAMIELINEDYADFVNLSTNLVGLEKTLETLKAPLLSYKEQISQAHRLIEETLSAVQAKLQKREFLYSRKIALQNLEHITHTLDKIERLLGLAPNASTDQDQLSGDLVERVAAEINHLNFCVAQCEATSFIQEIQPRLNVIGDKLRGALETQLLDSITSQNMDVLKRCLRIFATVDQIADAELLVREKVVRPCLEEVVTEPSLHGDPLGLKGVFQRVMKVVPQKLRVLLQLTSEKHSGKKGTEIKDFNFLVNSVWPEITEQIDENLSFVFSAGHPEKFYMHYQTSMSFLADFEAELGSRKAIRQFKTHPALVAFNEHWNLPVYFQIRFQEIALPVESALTAPFDPVEDSERSQFRLKATEVVHQAAQKCWQDGIYLSSLAHRFLKLSLQVLSRYSKAVEMAPDMMVEAAEQPSPSHSVDLKKSATTIGLRDLDSHKRGHRRNASDAMSDDHDAEPVREVVLEPYKNRPRDIISLWLDVAKLVKAVPDLATHSVQPRLIHLPGEQQEAVLGCFSESCGCLSEQLPVLSSLVVSYIAEQSVPFLKQVSDIPRLYRRTNREVPSKPCSYITSVFSPIETFYKEQERQCPEEAIRQWLVAVFERIVEQYLSNVSEVLAAVQKMEESLRRLKRVRDAKALAAGNGEESKSASASISDDDKIRLQLFLDVQFFLKQMSENYRVAKESVPKAGELDRTVKEATKTLEAVRGRV